MIDNIKYKNLIEYLKSLESAVVAFSGGVDSTFLLKACKEALGDKVTAITIASPYVPRWEISEAEELIKDLNINHILLEIVIPEEIKFNPEDRCYLCKKKIFSLIKDIALKKGYNYVLDGTNADDIKDYRPGLRALKELEIKSPLLENNITKEDIRLFSKELNLNTWNKPAYACLLSRIPYGTKIELNELEKIEKSETYLIELGFKAIRVRSHGDIARIEVPKGDRKRLFNEELLDNIVSTLKGFGYQYVTFDMEGYRMGSLNEEIFKKA